MKVILLAVVGNTVNQIEKPIHFAYLSNALAMAGIEHEIIDMMPMNPDARFIEAQKRFPDEAAIYCISAMTGNKHVQVCENIAQRVKIINSANIVIWGGTFVSAMPMESFKNLTADVIVTGEGERVLPDIIRAIERNDHYNQIINGTIPGIVLGPESEPDYRKIDLGYYIGYLKETGQSWSVMSSRGCWGNCEFCFRLAGPGIRRRSIPRVLDEIEWVMSEFGLDRIHFIDENFLNNHEWLEEFIGAKHDRKLNFTWRAQIRLDSVTEDRIKYIMDNGCVAVSSGAESVVPATLERIRKSMTVEQITTALDITRKLGLRHPVAFVMGFPWDTIEDWNALWHYVQSHDMKGRYKTHHYTPLPGSPLFKKLVAEGKIKDPWDYAYNLPDIYWDRYVNMTAVPDSVFDEWYDKIYQYGQQPVSYPTNDKYLRTIKRIY